MSGGGDEHTEVGLGFVTLQARAPARTVLQQGACLVSPACPFPGPLGFISASPFSAPAPHTTAAALSLPLFPSLLSLEPSPTHRCLSLLLTGDLLGRRTPVPHPQPPRPMWNGRVEKEGAGVMENPCSSQGQCLQTQSGL